MHKVLDLLTIADICIAVSWWTAKSESANISPVVGYSRTGKVHHCMCLEFVGFRRMISRLYPEVVVVSLIMAIFVHSFFKL